MENITYKRVTILNELKKPEKVYMAMDERSKLIAQINLFGVIRLYVAVTSEQFEDLKKMSSLIKRKD